MGDGAIPTALGRNHVEVSPHLAASRLLEQLLDRRSDRGHVARRKDPAEIAPLDQLREGIAAARNDRDARPDLIEQPGTNREPAFDLVPVRRHCHVGDHGAGDLRSDIVARIKEGSESPQHGESAQWPRNADSIESRGATLEAISAPVQKIGW